VRQAQEGRQRPNTSPEVGRVGGAQRPPKEPAGRNALCGQCEAGSVRVRAAYGKHYHREQVPGGAYIMWPCGTGNGKVEVLLHLLESATRDVPSGCALAEDLRLATARINRAFNPVSPSYPDPGPRSIACAVALIVSALAMLAFG